MSFVHVLALSALSSAMCPAATQVLEVAAVQQKARLAPAPAAVPRLERLVRESVLDALPVGWRLGHLKLLGASGDEARGLGRHLQVATPLPTPLVAGNNYVDVDVFADGRRQARMTAQVQLHTSVPARSIAIVNRGQEVTVVVRSGNVTVQTKGVAQQAAAIGERIYVLPSSGTHTVQAVLVDPATVEVQL